MTATTSRSPATAVTAEGTSDAAPTVPAMTGSAETVTTLRAFRFCLDPNTTQLGELARSAGAARWAYNHALAEKVAAHQAWRDQVAQLVAAGVDETQARRQVRVPTPTKAATQKALNAAKGDSRAGVDGVCPWWHEVSTYCFQSAFIDADTAWKNWLDSVGGRRAGRRVGYPRFKKKGRARDSFRIHHDVTRPTIRLAGYRRLLIPRLGEIRLHGTAKPLARLLQREQATVQSVTVSRAGHRWYASVLCKVTAPAARPTRAQRARGTVGVDVGVRTLAALSTGRLIPNPRYVDRADRRLAKAQRALSRTQKRSARRAKAIRRVARLHHETATRRATALHGLTKTLATGWAAVAVEDLHVAGMTRSARGTITRPGRNVAAKAGLNRRILDASFGEIRRQLEYKTLRYGSTLLVADRWAPTSKTCSACGWRNPSQTLAERTFTCTICGLSIDRDHNAAINIAAAATNPAAWKKAAVAPGTEETQNARRGDVRPATRTGSRQSPQKREDTEPVSPRRSDPPAPHKRAAAPKPAAA